MVEQHVFQAVQDECNRNLPLVFPHNRWAAAFALRRQHFVRLDLDRELSIVVELVEGSVESVMLEQKKPGKQNSDDSQTGTEGALRSPWFTGQSSWDIARVLRIAVVEVCSLEGKTKGPVLMDKILVYLEWMKPYKYGIHTNHRPTGAFCGSCPSTPMLHGLARISGHGKIAQNL